MVIPDVAGRVGYHKVKLAESSWPIATAAAVVGGDGDGTVTLGGVAATPLRIEIGAAWNDAVVDAAVRDRLVEPWEDELAPGSYRRDIAGAVARRALADVKTREQG
jgi:CO/xanthine dehydrogenase FAD-binding subunit